MRPKLKYIVFSLLLVLLIAFPLALQYQTGSLEGIVATERGPIAGASVEARNIMTGRFLTVRTDRGGRYFFPTLRPGRYSLWVETTDHVSVWIPKVFVERGQTTHQDIHSGPLVTTSGPPVRIRPVVEPRP